MRMLCCAKTLFFLLLVFFCTFRYAIATRAVSISLIQRTPTSFLTFFCSWEAMSRRCSHCGHNGHNSRTCVDKGFKLFGVRVTDSPSSSSTFCSSSAVFAVKMRKSLSLGNLFSCASSTAPPSNEQQTELLGEPLDGYASDDLVHTNSSSREKNKGIPWTKEEHKLFLLGLQKLGKGDWRGISRTFVKSRTPTQVASHAQKYFLRQSNLNKRRRRSSLFDITPDTVEMSKQVSSLHEKLASEELGFEPADFCSSVHDIRLGHGYPFADGEGREATLLCTHAFSMGGFPISLMPFPRSSLPMSVPEIAEEANEGCEAESMEGCEMSEVTKDALSADILVMDSVPDGNHEADLEPDHYTGPPFPLLPMWPGPGPLPLSLDSKLLKPTPIIPTWPSLAAEVADDLAMSSESSCISSLRPVMEPTPLSYKLLQASSRYSAFHSMSSVGSSELDNQGSLISAVSVP